MISPIIDTSSKDNFVPFNQLEDGPVFGKAIFNNLTEHMVSTVSGDSSPSRLIKNGTVIIPSCVIEMYKRLGAHGTVSPRFNRTQNVIATNQDGAKRVGGLEVSLILGFSNQETQKSFAGALYDLACFFEDRFFPIACSFDWYYIFAISLEEQNYGAVFGIETYGCDPIFNETPPKPEYLYPSIDAFLDDLGPEKSYEETAIPKGVSTI